ncbi:MAG TPA: hypothetical protein VJV21_07820 [Pyrinomonadaceae bacterium]|nr:hypothetical protein [Pyrinomonadaceae bacterium]
MKQPNSLTKKRGVWFTGSKVKAVMACASSRLMLPGMLAWLEHLSRGRRR